MLDRPAPFLADSAPLALCLNSSFLGVFAHAGFVSGLDEAGIRATHVSGSSAGAVVAAHYAQGRSGAEILALMRAADLRSIFSERLAPFRAVGALLGTRGLNAAFRAPGAEALMRTWWGEARIENTPRARLGIGVTNLTRGRGETSHQGSIWEHVLASCAVPGMFAARVIDGETLVDGGFADPEPIGQWIGDGTLGTILVHRIDRSRPMPAQPRLSWILDRGHRAAGAMLAAAREELVRGTGQTLTVVETRAQPPRVGWPFSSAHGPRWESDCDDRYEAGRRSAQQWVESTKAAATKQSRRP